MVLQPIGQIDRLNRRMNRLPEAEEPIEYDVILTEPAEIEVEAAYLRRIKSGMDNAEKWYAGFALALAGLSVFPRRFPLATESDFLGRRYPPEVLWQKQSCISYSLSHYRTA